MAKKDASPIQSTPMIASAAKRGNPFLVLLIVILILTGIIDAVLWGVVGYCALGGGLQNASSSGVVPSAAVRDGNASDDGGEKREALEAYIQKMYGEVVPLNSEMVESYNSIRAMDDDAAYAELTERTRPLCQQMVEKVLEIDSDDLAIGELCKLYQDYVTQWLNALSMMTSALENQDAA